MQKSSKKFVGSHDFRNFCKVSDSTCRESPDAHTTRLLCINFDDSAFFTNKVTAMSDSANVVATFTQYMVRNVVGQSAYALKALHFGPLPSTSIGGSPGSIL